MSVSEYITEDLKSFSLQIKNHYFYFVLYSGISSVPGLVDVDTDIEWKYSHQWQIASHEVN